MVRLFFLLCASLAFSGCAYMGTWAKQSYYTFQLSHSPRLRITKHLLDRPTFFVFGKVEGSELPASTPVAVLAISSAPVQGEVVDVSQAVRSDSYYGLNLPPGDYLLVAAADRDGDGIVTERELIATRSLQLTDPAADKILGGYDLDARSARPSAPPAFRVTLHAEPDPAPSVFFPKGSIRSLDDPIFSPRMATLGLYEPAAFMEVAPMMFYALEESSGHKVPVIFVHGIDGSARDFADIVAGLDRQRYQAWFFDYPSGGDLNQLGAMFYEIFLSGNVVPRPFPRVVIVAHSMGGLVVREALNRWHGTAREAAIASLITIASPLGGHPAAAKAKHAPVVLPAWRDLDPQGDFIARLHRTPLPASLTYHLFFTVGEPGKAGTAAEPGDGVVPLSSQLDEAARREATEQVAFEANHTGVLHDLASVGPILRTIEEIKTPVPSDHLREIDRGGYALALPEKEFTPLELYLVRTLGHYLTALVDGTITPIDPVQTQLIEECTGRRSPDLPAARAWHKLIRLHPQRETWH